MHVLHKKYVKNCAAFLLNIANKIEIDEAAEI